MSTIYTDDYIKQTYVNRNLPAINGAHLNHTENGIKDLSGKVANLSRELNTVEVEGLNPRGEWDNTTAYAVKDLVQYNGVSYVCHVANSGHTPTDTSYWQIVGYPIQIVDDLNSTSPDKALSANMGRVLNQNVSAIGEAVVNCWDEQWELGIINSTTGENSASSSSFRTKGFIPVKPLTEYYCVVPSDGTYLATRWYDANKNYIGINDANGNSTLTTNAIRKAPSNAYYLRFWAGDNKTVYNNNISINYPSSFTSYYPSRLAKDESHIGSLGSAIAMRGWNQLVKNGNFVNSANWTPASCTLTVANNTATLAYNGEPTRPYIAQYLDKIIPSGHVIYARAKMESSGVPDLRLTVWNSGFTNGQSIESRRSGVLEGIFTANSDKSIIITQNYVGVQSVGHITTVQDVMLIDLTELFGAGNEPSTVEEFKAMFPADYYPYASGSWADLLWTNASPNAAFAAQTISVDLSRYSAVRIVYKQWYSTDPLGVYNAEISQIIDVGSIGDLPAIPTSLCHRKVTINANSVVFDGGYFMASYYSGNYASADGVSIPLKIYGIK